MIHEERTLFLRLQVGEAKNGKRKFEMSVNAGDYSPIIRLPDGRWWTIGWNELLAMAEDEAAATAGGGV